MPGDEFDGANASRPDHSKWKFEVGGNGWGNHELEYYTDRPENSRVDQGKLIIEARREDYTGEDGVTRQYTSARLITRGTFSQAYGRFTARIKLPRGQGVWPAFWLLGDDFEKVSWPACDEHCVSDEPALHRNLEITWLVHPCHIERKRQ